MNDIPLEVLIYIEKIKKFFEDNETTKKYFINEKNEEKFFEVLTTISTKVFEQNGDPTLNEKQFEFIRIITRDFEFDDDKYINEFIYIKNHKYLKNITIK